jgi:hypothetical protein
MPENEHGIDLPDDIEFQRKSWRVQRIGWVAMLAIAVAALLGLFGNGPLSSARAGGAGSGLSITYERFTRKGAQHSIDVEAGPSSVVSDSVRIWIAREWVDANHVVGITPEPARSDVHPDRIVYTFNASRSDKPIAIRFELEAQWLGSRRGTAGIVNGPTVEFGQFAYP